MSPTPFRQTPEGYLCPRERKQKRSQSNKERKCYGRFQQFLGNVSGSDEEEK